MRIISIDFGEKSLGICISDQTNTISIPVGNFIFEHSNFNQAHEILKNVLERFLDIEIIVLGYPLTLQGHKTKITLLVEEFEEKIKQTFPEIKIVRFDERFTTKHAKEMFLSKYSNEEQKKLKDVASAYLILELYLNNLKN